MKTRIEELDIIRGYAIFGILVCNMVLFGHPIEYLGPYFADHTAWYDELSTYIRFNFFGDKTFTLFSLLFGVGIGMQYIKYQRRGRNFVRHHLTRMFLLLLIGLVHMWFIWYGDILGLYAVLGALALLFIRLPFRYLLGLAILFFIWPTIQTILIRNGLMQIGGKLGEVKSLEALVAQNKTGLSGHLSYNFSQVPGTIQFYLTGTLYYSMSMILLGIAMAKCEVHLMIKEHLAKYKRVLLVSGIMVALWHGYQLFFFDPNGMGTAIDFYVYWFFFQLSIPGQTFFVIAAIILIMQGRTVWLQQIRIFRHLGRLSLTNYLFHSVLGFFLFKMMGQFGSSSPGLDMLLTIWFTGLQIFISKIWLRMHNMGPVESLWRWSTQKLLGAKR